MRGSINTTIMQCHCIMLLMTWWGCIVIGVDDTGKIIVNMKCWANFLHYHSSEPKMTSSDVLFSPNSPKTKRYSLYLSPNMKTKSVKLSFSRNWNQLTNHVMWKIHLYHQVIFSILWYQCMSFGKLPEKLSMDQLTWIQFKSKWILMQQSDENCFATLLATV